jgi:hypothetical protein
VCGHWALIGFSQAVEDARMRTAALWSERPYMYSRHGPTSPRDGYRLPKSRVTVIATATRGHRRRGLQVCESTPRSQRDQVRSHRRYRRCVAARRCCLGVFEAAFGPTSSSIGLLPAALGTSECGAPSLSPTSSQYCHSPQITTGRRNRRSTSTGSRSSVNQKCDVRLGYEKLIIDRAELDCVAKTHRFSVALILCRSMILSSALLPWLLPPLPERGC